MKRFLVLVAACWLSAGISLAQELPETPARLLALAVAKAQSCDYTTKWSPLDGGGNPTGKWKDEKKKRDAQALSLPNLFKPGRYNLGESVEQYQVDGRSMLKITFSPVAKELQMKPGPNEDDDTIKAINSMEGSVVIDEETLGVVGITSTLVNGFDFWRRIYGVPVPARMETMSVTMIQRINGTTWLPEAMELKASGRSRPGLVEVRRIYLTTFDCSTRATQ